MKHIEPLSLTWVGLDPYRNNVCNINDYIEYPSIGLVKSGWKITHNKRHISVILRDFKASNDFFITSKSKLLFDRSNDLVNNYLPILGLCNLSSELLSGWKPGSLPSLLGMCAVKAHKSISMLNICKQNPAKAKRTGVFKQWKCSDRLNLSYNIRHAWSVYLITKLSALIKVFLKKKKKKKT